MSTVHVVPLRDHIDHLVPGGLAGHGAAPGRWLCIETDPAVDVSDAACACGPTVELVPSGRGDGWLIVHHSLDGREQREAASG